MSVSYSLGVYGLARCLQSVCAHLIVCLCLCPAFMCVHPCGYPCKSLSGFVSLLVSPMCCLSSAAFSVFVPVTVLVC